MSYSTPWLTYAQTTALMEQLIARGLRHGQIGPDPEVRPWPDLAAGIAVGPELPDLDRWRAGGHGTASVVGYLPLTEPIGQAVWELCQRLFASVGELRLEVGVALPAPQGSRKPGDVTLTWYQDRRAELRTTPPGGCWTAPLVQTLAEASGIALEARPVAKGCEVYYAQETWRGPSGKIAGCATQFAGTALATASLCDSLVPLLRCAAAFGCTKNAEWHWRLIDPVEPYEAVAWDAAAQRLYEKLRALPPLAERHQLDLSLVARDLPAMEDLRPLLYDEASWTAGGVRLGRTDYIVEVAIDRKRGYRLAFLNEHDICLPPSKLKLLLPCDWE